MTLLFSRWGPDEPRLAQINSDLDFSDKGFSSISERACCREFDLISGVRLDSDLLSVQDVRHVERLEALQY